MASTDPGVNNSSQDLVAILDNDTFEVLFSGASIMRVTVREPSVFTKWTVEDGTERTDHRVILSVEIDLPLLLTDNTRSLYESLRQAYRDARSLTIQTKVSSYPDMLIIDFPHDETWEQGESIPISIKLREVETVEPQFGTLPPRKVTNQSQSDTVEKGQQRTEESTDRRGSVLYTLVN